MILLVLFGCPPTDPVDTAACATLDVSTCATRADCAVIYGNPLELVTPDTAGAEPCVSQGESEALGCMDAKTGCDDIETYGQSADGTCAVFPSSCQPSGYTPCDPDPKAYQAC